MTKPRARDRITPGLIIQYRGLKAQRLTRAQIVERMGLSLYLVDLLACRCASADRAAEMDRKREAALAPPQCQLKRGQLDGPKPMKQVIADSTARIRDVRGQTEDWEARPAW